MKLSHQITPIKDFLPLEIWLIIQKHINTDFNKTVNNLNKLYIHPTLMSYKQIFHIIDSYFEYYQLDYTNPPQDDDRITGLSDLFNIELWSDSESEISDIDFNTLYSNF
jgi:hypothetical protein